MTECPDCAENIDEWDDHFGAQGWLCEPAPAVVRVAVLTKALLASHSH